MPYSIKGKSHKWEEKTKVGQKIDARIEGCVDKLMADPNFKPQKGRTKKQAAIAVCKSTVTRSEEFKSQLS